MGLKIGKKFKTAEQKYFQLLTNPSVLNLFHELSSHNIELTKILGFGNIRRFVQS